jgi:hypothetical protein
MFGTVLRIARFKVMALSSRSMRQASILERLGNMLHVHYDEIANEPIPQRWVDLIHYLNEKEKARAEAQQPPESEPRVQRPRSH